MGLIINYNFLKTIFIGLLPVMMELIQVMTIILVFITGPPGAGKSTLVAALTPSFAGPTCPWPWS